MIVERSKPLVLYVSGDPGSVELRRLCRVKGMVVDIRDIRKERKDLVFLIQKGLTTVPQVFDRTGDYVGDFGRVAAGLRKLPDFRKGNSVA